MRCAWLVPVGEAELQPVPQGGSDGRSTWVINVMVNNDNNARSKVLRRFIRVNNGLVTVNGRGY